MSLSAVGPLASTQAQSRFLDCLSPVNNGLFKVISDRRQSLVQLSQVTWWLLVLHSALNLVG